MDEGFLESNEHLTTTWVEEEVFELFKAIISTHRDRFYALTVDFDLSDEIRDDARRRGKHLDLFLDAVELAYNHIDYDKDALDIATRIASKVFKQETDQ